MCARYATGLQLAQKAAIAELVVAELSKLSKSDEEVS